MRFWIRCFLVNVRSPTAPASATWGCVHRAARILDRPIQGQDEARCLWCRRQSVDSHDGRLPDAGGEVVHNVFVVDVHAIPHTALRWGHRLSLRFLVKEAPSVLSVVDLCPTCACLARSLFKMLVASKPALSHSCRGMISRALAYAPINSCCFPGTVLE